MLNGFKRTAYWGSRIFTALSIPFFAIGYFVSGELSPIIPFLTFLTASIFLAITYKGTPQTALFIKLANLLVLIFLLVPFWTFIWSPESSTLEGIGIFITFFGLPIFIAQVVTMRLLIKAENATPSEYSYGFSPLIPFLLVLPIILYTGYIITIS